MTFALQSLKSQYIGFYSPICVGITLLIFNKLKDKAYESKGVRGRESASAVPNELCLRASKEVGSADLRRYKRGKELHDFPKHRTPDVFRKKTLQMFFSFEPSL